MSMPASRGAFIGRSRTSLQLAPPAKATAVALPSGVTLQAIDGGATYYASNGFTLAASTQLTGTGWDSPAFFPIGQDYCFYPDNSAATFFDLGLNFTHRTTSNASLPGLRADGIWVLNAGDTDTGQGYETFGYHVEEPDTWSDIQSDIGIFDGFPDGGLAGRLLQCSFTWNQLFYGTISGAPGNSSMPYVMGSPTSTTTAGEVHLNIPGDDLYWFAASNTENGQYEGGNVMQNNGVATAAQMARGTNYGDTVDMMRQWMSGAGGITGYPAPCCPYIETEDGLVGGGQEILPAELNWAVWATIIHGARWILYFSTTSNYGSESTFGFSQTPLAGQSISMFTQGQNTNGLVANLAPVIHAPFALGYATVSPTAYVFPVPLACPALSIFDGWTTTGIDIMAKYYTGGSYTNGAGTFSNGFYIFATYRGDESATNISATFTTASGYSGIVYAINADGGSSSYATSYTLSAAAGVFTDTFAKGSSVRIYHIPYGLQT